MTLATVHADPFDYLMVIPGVIAALTLSRLLAGGALLLQHRHVKPYAVHLAWAAMLFTAQVQFWLVSHRWAERSIDPSLAEYMAFLAFPVLLYLASEVLTPPNAAVVGPDFSLRRHYFDHATPFFGLCCVATLLVIILGGVLDVRPWLSAYNASRGIGVAVTFLLAVVGRKDTTARREQFHIVLTVLAVISFALFLGIPLLGLGADA